MLSVQVLAVVFAFMASVPGVQSMVLTLLCVCFLALHLTYRPMRDAGAQRLQTVLLFCLTGVALSGLPMAVVRQQAAAASQLGFRGALDLLTLWLYAFCAYLVPISATLWILFGTLHRRYVRPGCWPAHCLGLVLRAGTSQPALYAT